MNAIIFLAPISCFDQVLAEDPSVNRLVSALSVLCPPNQWCCTGRFSPVVDIDCLEQAAGRYPAGLVPQQVRLVKGQD